jgi:hypothetical protein
MFSHSVSFSQVGEVMTMLGVETNHLRTLLHNNLSRERGVRAVVEATMVLAVLFSQSVTLALCLGGTVRNHPPHLSRPM